MEYLLTHINYFCFKLMTTSICTTKILTLLGLSFSFYFSWTFYDFRPICNWKEDFLPLQPSKCLIFWRKYFRGNEKWRRTKSQFVGSLFWTHYWQENDKKSISPFMAENSGKMSRKTTFSPRKAKRPRRRPAKKIQMEQNETSDLLGLYMIGYGTGK